MKLKLIINKVIFIPITNILRFYLRQSYSQEPIVLNRAVIRSLINLPFLVNCNIHGDLEKYSVTFNEVGLSLNTY